MVYRLALFLTLVMSLGSAQAAPCDPAPPELDESGLMTYYCDPASDRFCPSHPLCGPASDAETPPPATLRCCECFYVLERQCTDAAPSTEAKCLERNEKWEDRNKKDCRWKQGRCTTRHELDCDELLSDPDAPCDLKVTTPIPIPRVKDQVWPPKPTVDPKMCSSYRDWRRGHGWGEEYFVEHIVVCLKAFGDSQTCNDFWFTDGGCSVFKNLDAAREEVQRITKELGGTQCVRVQANQCWASLNNSNYYQFTLLPTGLCNETAQDCNFGGHCPSEALQSAVCKSDTGELVWQTCCPNLLTPLGWRTWVEGRDCENSRPEPYEPPAPNAPEAQPGLETP